MSDKRSNDLRLSPVQTLAKAAAALERVGIAGELSAMQLAAEIGEPRSSVYRLLAGLTAAGLIEPGSSRGTYRLGMKLFELGSRVAQRFDERQLAFPVMERIHQLTDQTVFLCVRRHFEAVCIERLNGKQVQTLELLLGGTLPLHVGAGPQVLLAFESDDFRENYFREAALTRYTPKSKVSARALRAELGEIVRRGHSVSDEDVTIGIAAIGAPIFDHTARIRASLSLSGVRPAVLGEAQQEITRLVVDGAAEVSQLLGYGLALPVEGLNNGSGDVKEPRRRAARTTKH